MLTPTYLSGVNNISWSASTNKSSGLSVFVYILVLASLNLTPYCDENITLPLVIVTSPVLPIVPMFFKFLLKSINCVLPPSPKYKPLFDAVVDVEENRDDGDDSGY